MKASLVKSFFLPLPIEPPGEEGSWLDLVSGTAQAHFLAACCTVPDDFPAKEAPWEGLRRLGWGSIEESFRRSLEELEASLAVEAPLLELDARDAELEADFRSPPALQGLPPAAPPVSRSVSFHHPGQLFGDAQLSPAPWLRTDSDIAATSSYCR
eukprot:TRINITY_DN72221_c0_g1_i1.p2 TRINITY_DN72221_c0_g1~~TRINITY_DN72221_c0_g1_i1.p2  ORF type:complete len:155 (-),score=30.75 TRINITY_DN72221_c0_g1_i1:8-472(-)